MHVDITMNNKVYNVDFKVDDDIVIIENLKIDGFEPRITDEEREAIINSLQDIIGTNLLVP